MYEPRFERVQEIRLAGMKAVGEPLVSLLRGDPGMMAEVMGGPPRFEVSPVLAMREPPFREHRPPTDTLSVEARDFQSQSGRFDASFSIVPSRDPDSTVPFRESHLSVSGTVDPRGVMTIDRMRATAMDTVGAPRSWSSDVDGVASVWSASIVDGRVDSSRTDKSPDRARSVLVLRSPGTGELEVLVDGATSRADLSGMPAWEAQDLRDAVRSSPHGAVGITARIHARAIEAGGATVVVGSAEITDRRPHVEGLPRASALTEQARDAAGRSGPVASKGPATGIGDLVGRLRTMVGMSQER